MRKILFILLCFVTFQSFGQLVATNDIYRWLKGNQYKEISTPTFLPPFGVQYVYFKTDHNFYKLNSAGVETCISCGGGGTGTVTSIATTTPITGGTITTTGTIGLSGASATNGYFYGYRTSGGYGMYKVKKSSLEDFRPNELVFGDPTDGTAAQSYLMVVDSVNKFIGIGISSGMDSRITFPTTTNVSDGISWGDAHLWRGLVGGLPALGIDVRLYLQGDLNMSGGGNVVHANVYENVTDGNSSRLSLLSTGAYFSRNIADANPALIVEQVNGTSTGDLLQLKYAGATNFGITSDGYIYSSAGSPSDGDVPTWVAANGRYEPMAGGGGGGISALTNGSGTTVGGDLTSVDLGGTLTADADVNGNSGTYGMHLTDLKDFSIIGTGTNNCSITSGRDLTLTSGTSRDIILNPGNNINLNPVNKLNITNITAGNGDFLVKDGTDDVYKLTGTTVGLNLLQLTDPSAITFPRINADNSVSALSAAAFLTDIGAEPTLADAAADGTTKGKASFTANDFNSSSGNISIDYTNGQAAATAAKGFLTATDWNTFNNKQAALVNTTNIKSVNGNTLLGSGNLQTPVILPCVGSMTTMADGATVYSGLNPQSASNTADQNNMLIPVTGTIIAVYITFLNTTPSTSETSTLNIRYDNTTDNLISNTVAHNATKTTVAVTGLSIAVTAGHYIELKEVLPTYATNPATVRWSGSILIQ